MQTSPSSILVSRVSFLTFSLSTQTKKVLKNKFTAVTLNKSNNSSHKTKCDAYVNQSLLFDLCSLTYKYTESKLICCYSHIYRRLMIFVAYPEIKCYDDDHPSQEKKTVRGFLVLLLLNYRYSTFSFVYRRRKKNEPNLTIITAILIILFDILTDRA